MNHLAGAVVQSANAAIRSPRVGLFSTALVAMAIVWKECPEENPLYEKVHEINKDERNFLPQLLLLNTRTAMCQEAVSPTTPSRPNSSPPPLLAKTTSWVRRNLLAPIGIPLPIPRLLTLNDPALTLAHRYRQQRLRDETNLRNMLEKVANNRQEQGPETIKALQQELCEITFGKGVTAQAREDFLLQYGCTGWTDQVLDVLVDLCETRGMVEIGAGHGQWARALTETYQARQNQNSDASYNNTNNDNQKHKHADKMKKYKQFDFCLAYDDMSNLPLNTHIYNPYTQPHHDYFGTVQTLEVEQLPRVLQSWQCRGRVLLLVYPPPGEMAWNIVQNYVDAAPEQNDTVVFVGEGRGGANANDAFFDYLERGDWILLKMMDVKKPPGDKGYEKVFVFQRGSGTPNHLEDTL